MRDAISRGIRPDSTESLQFTSTALPGSPTLDALVADSGEAWSAFRRTLVPRYAVAWRDIGMCYAFIAVGVVLSVGFGRNSGAAAGLGVVLLAAVWTGYWISSLMSFMHEAAHFNLHWDKTTNDRLANLLLCPLVGEEITHYRALHWQHHLHLGSPEDTEVSYHHAPTPWFLLQAATGIHVLRVLRGKYSAQAARHGLPGHTSGTVRGMIVHGAIVLPAVANGLYGVALAWCVAAFLVYPFCTGLRQLLEHRAADAAADIDYALEEHGPVNRMFGTDPFSRTFGAAGFNRHLLHHWYPSASYTRFDDLEGFFMRTPLASAVDAARATYWGTLRTLMRPAGSRPQ